MCPADFETHATGTGERLGLVETQARKLDAYWAEIERLRALVAIGVQVVDDFMPNIGNCALQDIGRLNDFLMAADTLAKQVAAEETEGEDPQLFKCAGASCPGLPYPASQYGHPASCAVEPDHE